MNISTHTTTILKSSEGHFLTEVADVPDSVRTVTDTIYLNNPDDASNWKEITDAEAEVIREARKQFEDNINKELESKYRKR